MNDALKAANDRASMVELVKQSVMSWMNDYAPSMGAALSYYTLFSLAPLLLLVIAVAGLVFNADVARGEVLAQLGGLIGTEGSVAIEGLLNGASRPTQSLIASVISIVTLIVGATSVFAELQSDLDRIWRAPAAVRPSGVWGLLRTRLLSFGLILSIGFLLLVSLIVSAALAAFGKWYGAWFPGWVITLQIMNQVVSLAFVTVLFAIMYRVLPSVHVAWQDVWRGAFVTAVLFTIGKFLIGLYLGKAEVTSGFGAAGAIVVLLVWVFYSAQIFLLGAEFTWLYAHSQGSRSDVADEDVKRTKDVTWREVGPTGSNHAALPVAVPRSARAADVVMAGFVWIGVGIIRSIWRRGRARRSRMD
jgi:membrane protein